MNKRIPNWLCLVELNFNYRLKFMFNVQFQLRQNIETTRSIFVSNISYNVIKKVFLFALCFMLVVVKWY